MTEHDPEFPYVIKDFSGHVFAKFHKDERHLAQWFADNHLRYKEVIDTTPRPKIPEDARFIYWPDEYGDPGLAERRGVNWLLMDGSVFSTDDLLNDVIGDAEITVLVPKEEA